MLYHFEGVFEVEGVYVPQWDVVFRLKVGKEGKKVVLVWVDNEEMCELVAFPIDRETFDVRQSRIKGICQAEAGKRGKKNNEI